MTASLSKPGRSCSRSSSRPLSGADCGITQPRPSRPARTKNTSSAKGPPAVVTMDTSCKSSQVTCSAWPPASSRRTPFSSIRIVGLVNTASFAYCSCPAAAGPGYRFPEAAAPSEVTPRDVHTGPQRQPGGAPEQHQHDVPGEYRHPPVALRPVGRDSRPRGDGDLAQEEVLDRVPGPGGLGGEVHGVRGPVGGPGEGLDGDGARQE